MTILYALLATLIKNPCIIRPAKVHIKPKKEGYFWSVTVVRLYLYV